MSAPIAENRRARFDYHVEERFEAGIVLVGWEIKAIRDGQVQLTDGYVVIRDGELFLIGCRVNPLRSASTHVHPEPDRTRKLLMHKDEIRRLIGKVEQRSFTLVPLNFGPAVLISLYWKRMTCKGALASIIVGGITVLVWKQFGWFGLYEIVRGFLLSGITVFVVSLIDEAPSEDILREFDQSRSCE